MPFLRPAARLVVVSAYSVHQERSVQTGSLVIGKQQVRRIGHEARRRHDGVLTALKEIEKVLPNLAAGA